MGTFSEVEIGQLLGQTRFNESVVSAFPIFVCMFVTFMHLILAFHKVYL
jgi:hypothetical protein